MAEDMFGDSSLFEEFDKERDASSSFIFYEKADDGQVDKSKIHFQISDLSDESSEEDSDSDEKSKLKEQSVVYTVGKLQKQAGVRNDGPVTNGENDSGDDSSDDEEEDDRKPFVSKDRLEAASSYKLNYERNKFKRYCNIIDSTRFIHDEETPAIQVLFQNNAFARKYRTKIEHFLESLIEDESRKRHEIQQKLDLKATVPSCTDLNDKIPVEKRTDRMWQSHAIIGCSQFYKSFLMDTLGWPLVEYNPSLTESWDIPTYEQVFTDTLPVDVEEMKMRAKKAERDRFKPKCWNCGGDHMMTECKQPRNQQKINESRQAMMAEKAANQQQALTRQSSVRYHEETSVDPKFAAFKPGKISAGLREALGLSENQMPVYIYKMRALGYPPGWMAEAQKTEAPGLAMFGKDGTDEGEEEGENGETLEVAPPDVDVSKVIEYPGFTTEPPMGSIDEAEYYGLPPLQPHQLKSTLVMQTQIVQEQMGKRKQEAAEETERKRQRLAPQASDMDLDESSADTDQEFRPPLPPDTPTGDKPPLPEDTPPDTPIASPMPPPIRSLSRQGSEARSVSPSLEELEAQYKLIQQSLANENEDSEDTDVMVVDSNDDSQSDSQGEKSANPIVLDDSSSNPIVLGDSMSSDSEKLDYPPGKLMRNESTTSIQTFGELGIGSPMSSQPGTPLVISQPGTPLPNASTDTRESSPFIEINSQFKGTASISKDYGTPILQKGGSAKKLPSDVAFQQGIEDHIPFENLPDATGTFNKMRKLLDTIKQKMSFNKKKKS